MKGIILSGGKGSRLFPLTLAVSKQLLPIYDKPMIYYPLSTLMWAGIRDILILSTPEDLPRFQTLLGTGEELGMHFEYKEQPSPRGLAEAFILGASFIGDDSVALILGDNLFYGPGLCTHLEEATKLKTGSLIFGYQVKDPERYGVIEFDPQGKVIGFEEKPKQPKSSFAVPGLYFYGPEVVDIANTLKPSKRGELEITDLHQIYLQRNELSVRLLGRGYAWLDTGTFDAFQKAALFVETLQERQGILIGCIEEVAYQKGYISKEMLLKRADRYPNEYGKYLETACRFGFCQFSGSFEPIFDSFSGGNIDEVHMTPRKRIENRPK